MSSPIPLKERQRRYAGLIVRFGVNLQPGQGLVISYEPVAREFANLLVVEAYQAGAKYVHLDCDDPLAKHARLAHIKPEHLEYVPEYEVARRDQYVDETWARIAITAQEFPQLFDDIDAGLMARAQSARAEKLKRYTEAIMSAKFQWCVVAVPTKSWARQVFPKLPAARGLARLWDLVLRAVRADQPNPAAAWAAHDERLKKVSAYLATQRVTGVHFFDPVPADDGAPSTDLRIGLTDSSVWVAASSTTPNDVSFMANMPTEEVFTSPHRMKTEGYARTSKPIFPLGREVREAYFRFEGGECVEARAKHGQDALLGFLEIPGTRRLGEVALVDVRSPINQAGLTFFDTLFDENAACHIAFGKAYTEAVAGADEMTGEARIAHGMNDSHAHEDFMIGTATMRVDGIRADGGIVPVMRDGMFVDAIYQ